MGKKYILCLSQKRHLCRSVVVQPSGRGLGDVIDNRTTGQADEPGAKDLYISAD